MRAWAMVVFGLFLATGCGIDGDELGGSIGDEEAPVASESAALSYSWTADFGDWKDWWRGGSQSLPGGYSSLQLAGYPVFFGSAKTWVGRNYEFPLAAGLQCTLKARVNFLSEEDTYAKLRIKIVPNGASGAAINHSYEIQPSGPDGLTKWAVTPKFTMPEGFSLDLIADAKASPPWNNFDIDKLVFTCSL
jgi:hypothetical protein